MNNFLSALATVTLLLGEEEEALIATLYTVEVIIHVEKANGESTNGDVAPVNFTDAVSINNNKESYNNLNDSHLGKKFRHDETLLDSVNFLSGLGGGIHGTLAVEGHFYYL